MLSWIPEEPPVPAGQRAGGRATLRFEDVSQDGRLVVESLPNTLGEVWRCLEQHRASALGDARGIVPVLSRVVIEGGGGPISVLRSAEMEGAFQLAHTNGKDGGVDRLILGMWARVSSVVGRTQGAQPEGAGRPVLAGRVFAEHVFTRPFGPPAERKVRAFSVEGRLVVPDDVYVWRDAEATLTLPEGAVALDDAMVLDPAYTVFGLDHTDSNQHVNSLVYTRLFIESALRRLAAHGRSRPPLLARALEIAYRKPSFAGERVRVLVRAFEVEGALGATAALVTDEEARGPLDAVRPRTFARLLFGT